MFDGKSNTVTISVICCSPENVAGKIRSKAGGTIKGLDIKPTSPPAKPLGDKPKEGGGPPPQMKQAPPQQAAQPKQAPPQADKPKSAPPKGNGGGGGNGEKPKPQPQKMADGGGGGNVEKPKKVDFAPMGPPAHFPMGPPQMMSAPKPNQPAAFMSPETIPVAGYPSIFPPVVYHDGGPYYQNQGMAAPQRFPHSYQPVYQYDGYTGRPVGNYFPEENPSTCSLM